MPRLRGALNQELPRGVPGLWVKRDDMTSLALGGKGAQLDAAQVRVMDGETAASRVPALA